MTILLNYRHFPVAMGRYWRMGFEALGHKVIGAGSMDERGPEYVPWSPPGFFPQYAHRPEILPESGLPAVDRWPLDQVLAMSPEKPDLIVQAGDVSWLSGDAPEGIPNVIVATDPHAVDLHPRLEHADLFVCMQDGYLKSDYADYTGAKTWIPYGYEQTIHRPLPGSPDKYDICLIGLLYPQRAAVLDRLRARGVRVFNDLGIAYHESNIIYNQSKIAFNFSSKLDVNARTFEGMAGGQLLVTNRLPDLEKNGFIENVHYVGFSSLEEAEEKVMWYLGHDAEREAIAKAGHEFNKPNTWANRAQALLDAVEGLK